MRRRSRWSWNRSNSNWNWIKKSSENIRKNFNFKCYKNNKKTARKRPKMLNPTRRRKKSLKLTTTTSSPRRSRRERKSPISLGWNRRLSRSMRCSRTWMIYPSRRWIITSTIPSAIELTPSRTKLTPNTIISSSRTKTTSTASKVISFKFPPLNIFRSQALETERRLRPITLVCPTPQRKGRTVELQANIWQKITNSVLNLTRRFLYPSDQKLPNEPTVTIPSNLLIMHFT